MNEGVISRESPIVQVSQFVKRYKKHVAVQAVDLAVRRGEMYGLIGPDGAGKSSLMKAIAGVLSYEGGEVEVFGIKVDTERAAERIKHKIGFLPQGLGLNLYQDLSVEENIDFFARLRLVTETELAARKARLLSMTRLDRFRERFMKHLSGGMKQKLGLICTLIHEPALAILDEPTTGTDSTHANIASAGFGENFGFYTRREGCNADYVIGIPLSSRSGLWSTYAGAGTWCIANRSRSIGIVCSGDSSCAARRWHRRSRTRR